MKIKNTKLYYFLIVFYGLIMVLITSGKGNVFGSEIDWVGQHSAFPETFRQNFYKTGRLLPDFLFEIGGGQNIFNFAYYGLLSPMFLLSYLLPFVDMVTYTSIVGVIQYIAGGVLLYVFFKKHFSKTNSFLAAIVYLSLGPFVVYSRYHIMFVWYMPFLILSFIGLDRYFDKKKSSLFIISTVCIILTNYYFSVGCLISLFVYAVYRILKDYEFSWKEFIGRCFKTGLVFLVPVLICGFFLFPTVFSIMAGKRPYKGTFETEMFLIPKIRNLLFVYSGYGITVTMFIALVGNLFAKKIKPCNAFLNAVLIFITVCPLVPYILNGTLYFSSKVIIPFLVLYMYAFVMFIQNLDEKGINISWPAMLAVLFLCICYNTHETGLWFMGFTIAEVILFLVLYKKPRTILLYTVLILCASIPKNDIKYASVDFVKSMYVDEIRDMMSETESGNYRSNVSHMDRYTCNRSYGENFMGVSSYSSTPNKHYLHFYENDMGNNESVRNSIMVTGSRNELFYSFMGTRYIFAQTDPGFSYEMVQSRENINMYENKNAYPLVYKAQNVVSEKDFDKVVFPYNTDILMNNTVVKEGVSSDYQSGITKYPVDRTYEFEVAEELTYSIELDEVFKNKLLYLTFNIDNTGEDKKHKIWEITINGVNNILNQRANTYYNENTNFEYVIPMEDTTTLEITISAGEFKIYGVEMYYSDAIYNKYTEADNLKFNNKNDTVTCSVDAKEGEYLVTSIPYDDGFSATINGKEVEIEMVNKAFVGLKLKDGENDIVLKYETPYLKPGIIISLAGIIAYIWILVMEKKRSKSQVTE